MVEIKDGDYAHRTDTEEIQGPKYDTSSGPVYINENTDTRPMPAIDEVYLSSEEEHIGEFPEGAYQTWNSREQDSFNPEDSIDVVNHFFSEEGIEVPKNPNFVDKVEGYNSIDRQGW